MLVTSSRATPAAAQSPRERRGRRARGSCPAVDRDLAVADVDRDDELRRRTARAAAARNAGESAAVPDHDAVGAGGDRRGDRVVGAIAAADLEREPAGGGDALDETERRRTPLNAPSRSTRCSRRAPSAAEPPRELDRVAALDRHGLPTSLREADDASLEDVDRRENVEVLVLTRYHAIMYEWPRTTDDVTTIECERSSPVDLVDGIDELAAAIRTLRTTDEVTRFLRDLCTRAELEALVAPVADGAAARRGRAVSRDRRAGADLDGDRDARGAVGAARHRRLPDRARAGEAAMSAFTRAGENGRLTLAVPAKGRMAEPTLRLCADAGLSFETTERSLVVPCANAPVDLLLVRPSDIPEYVQDGVVHLGVTGANLVVEAQADVVTLAELGFARCTLQAAVPNDAPQTSIADLDGLRVATAYPVSTKMLLDERGIEAELVPVSGSVEATPRLGLADAIVDLVSTGSTASANGLRLIGTLLSSQAVLIGGRGAVEEQHDLVERLELMLSGVVAARRRRYVMMNATTETLPAIRAVLPSMGAPTVLDAGRRGRRSPCTPPSPPTTSGRCCPRCATPVRRRSSSCPIERLVP